MVFDTSGGVDLITLLGNASGPIVLAFVVWGFLTGKLVTGRECNEVRAERDKAMALVYKQAEIASRALEVTDKWTGLP